MKRWAVRIAICLLLGAVINVAVAWLISTTVNVLDGERRVGFHASPDQMFEVTRWDAFGSTRLYASHSPSYGTAPIRNTDPLDLIPAYATDVGEPTVLFVQSGELIETRWIEARGWPLKSMVIRGGFQDGPNHPRQELDPTPAIQQPFSDWTTPRGTISIPRELPVYWQPRGFFLNSTVYAIVAYLLFIAPLDVRRLVRFRRGQCTKCGHRLFQEQRACPECGWRRDGGQRESPPGGARG